MNVLVECLGLILAVVLLVQGVRWIVSPLSKLGRDFGLSSFAIGATVVALGTNLPEIVVSVFYALTDESQAIFANLVGTNLFNVLVVLGGAAFIGPLMVEQRVVRQQLPLLLVSWLLVYPLALDRDLQRLDGMVLVSIGTFNVAFLLWHGRSPRPRPAPEVGEGRFTRAAARVISGFTFVLSGGWLLVTVSDGFERILISAAGAVSSDSTVLAVSLVAIATSAPELLASGIAALRGEEQLAVGTVIGSCVYNATFGFGLASFLLPVEVPGSFLTVDAPFVLVAALACFGLLSVRPPIDRLVGAYFMLAYLGFLAFVAIRALGLAQGQWLGIAAMSCGLVVFLPLVLPRRYVHDYRLSEAPSEEMVGE